MRTIKAVSCKAIISFARLLEMKEKEKRGFYMCTLIVRLLARPRAMVMAVNAESAPRGTSGTTKTPEFSMSMSSTTSIPSS